jgi:hypothetical protein
MAQKKKPDPTPPDPDDDDAPDGDDAPMTKGAAMKLINSAIASQLGRRLGPAIEQGLAPVLAKLDTIGKPPANDDETDDDDDAPPAKKNKADPAVSKLTKQLDQMKKQLEDERGLRTKEEAARKAALVDTELGRALDAVGVDKLRIGGALALKRAGAFVDDAGTVKFKAKRDGYEEEITVEDAMKEWAGTDEGKSYLAPTGSAGGSGARPPRTPTTPRKPVQNGGDAKAEDRAAAANALPALVDQMVGGGGIIGM